MHTVVAFCQDQRHANLIVNVKILNGGYEDKTCVSSFTNQITQQLFGPKPLAAEQQTRLDQTEVRRAEKNFLGDRLGSGPAIRQCVTISLCRHPTLLSQTFVHVLRQECR